MPKSNFSTSFRQYYAYVEPVISDPLVRGYFSLIASLVLITFLAIFALSPTINVVLGLRRQIADQKKIVDTLDTKITSIVAAQESYRQVEDVLPLLDQALPETPMPQGLIADVHKTASASGVNLISFQIQAIPLSKDLTAKTNGATGLPIVEFTLSLSGPKSRVRNFLGSLEQEIRYIRIENMSVNPNDKTGDFSANVSGIAFFYR